MVLGTEVGLGPGEFVFDGDSATSRKKKAQARHLPQPNFWPVFCGQMAGWIKMPLGTEVNVGSDNVVRWGRSSP